MRYPYSGEARTPAGAAIASATISVYLAGTTTPAKVWDAATSGSSSSSPPQAISDSYGRFTFWVDSADYSSAQLFKVVLASASVSMTRDNLVIVRAIQDGLTSNVIPTTDVTYTLGDSGHYYSNVYFQNLFIKGAVAGDILYASNANTFAILAKGTDAQVLTLVSGLPSWQTPATSSADYNELSFFGH